MSFYFLYITLMKIPVHTYCLNMHVCALCKRRNFLVSLARIVSMQFLCQVVGGTPFLKQKCRYRNTESDVFNAYSDPATYKLLCKTKFQHNCGTIALMYATICRNKSLHSFTYLDFLLILNSNVAVLDNYCLQL